jgi:GMP reductase
LIRDLCPDSIIMAGNVVTPEMVHDLLKSADIVKIGIGPGSACETRRVTGVGYPQLSACLECADAAHGLGGLICSDGGCRFPGDVAKAFAAGSDFVMIGGMFAGHDECDGEWEMGWDVKYKGDLELSKVKKSMKFYGMSSTEAMEKYNGGVAAYRASEGKCISVPYKGPVSQTVQQILGGLRSACAYVGAARLKDLSKCATFVRMTR